ncbi:MAG: NAD(+)/NADH kinase [Bacteroidia bacterium]|nr:NAD(+)/NADH kinase [Bacteroidia bacterium]
MKSIALFGRWTARIDQAILQNWLRFVRDRDISLWVEQSFAQHWQAVEKTPLSVELFSERSEITEVSLAFVIGGDGAFLEAARVVAPIGVPLIGIHAGRLGFLTDIPQQQLISATEALLSGHYSIEKRSLIAIVTEPEVFRSEEAFALNEVVFSKALTSEMILLDVYLNGELVNTYWADGLIVSTPTGSTAYSLACGGPILTPSCANFILTPIAPHSLTVRSLVMPDNGVLTVTFRSRTGQVQIALDGCSVTVPDHTAVALRRALTPLKVIKLSSYSYFQTLRDRLSWGVDRREGL